MYECTNKETLIFVFNTYHAENRKIEQTEKKKSDRQKHEKENTNNLADENGKPSFAVVVVELSIFSFKVCGNF